MNYKTFLSGTALSALAVPAAFAADLPARGPAPVPVFAVNSWTGFYVGIQAGGVFSDAQQRYHVGIDDCSAGNEAACVSKSTFGALIGVTAGYNLQSGNIVYGLEADIGGILGNKTTRNAFNPGLTAPSSTEVNGLASLRARIGVVSGPALFYVTGGFAAVNTKNQFLPASGYVGSKTTWALAPIAGLGIEYQLGGAWSAKLEGLYVFRAKSGVTDPAGFKAYRNITDHAIVRVGLNYRFGATSAPVVAKY